MMARLSVEQEERGLIPPRHPNLYSEKRCILIAPFVREKEDFDITQHICMEEKNPTLNAGHVEVLVKSIIKKNLNQLIVF